MRSTRMNVKCSGAAPWLRQQPSRDLVVFGYFKASKKLENVCYFFWKGKVYLANKDKKIHVLQTCFAGLSKLKYVDSLFLTVLGLLVLRGNTGCDMFFGGAY